MALCRGDLGGLILRILFDLLLLVLPLEVDRTLDRKSTPVDLDFFLGLDDDVVPEFSNDAFEDMTRIGCLFPFVLLMMDCLS